MNRTIVYSGEIPRASDILQLQRWIMEAHGWLIAGVLGQNTVFTGLQCVPTNPASMSVIVNPGALFSLQEIDTSAYGSLPANTNPLMKSGINTTPTTFTLTAPSTSGYSVNYLIQVQFQEADGNPTVLPYYNSANPSQPFSGPGNNGQAQNTARLDIAALQLVTGVAAPTGTQVTPAVESGWYGLWVITVNNAQTTITAADISPYSGAPASGAPFASLAGNPNQQFAASQTIVGTNVPPLSQIQAQFAPINGSSANSFAVAPASSSAPQNAPQYGQIFQLLGPSASGNITLTALRTIVVPTATSAITLTMQPGTIVGQECQIEGTSYGVTVQSNVSSGSPYFIFPDNTDGYSFTLSGYGTSQTLIWDGTNWRVRTFGQMVVGTPAAQNQAAPLSYLEANFAATSGSSTKNFNADILYATEAVLGGIFNEGNNSAIILGVGYTGSVNYANNANVPHQCAPAANAEEAVTLGQFTNSFNGSAATFIIQRPDGVIEQWFQASVTTGGSGTYSFTLNFPEAFPNVSTGAVVGFQDTVPNPGSCGWSVVSSDQITVLVDTDAAQTIRISIVVTGY